ncbi:MAG: AMP-dependent synthetase/ligase [Acidobacteriaceae bacterium]
MLNLTTINDVFFTVAGRGHHRVMLVQGADDAWRPVSGAEVYRRVLAVARALRHWGVRKGDRVALLAENRWEWAVTDYAVLALGAVDVPIYPTLPADHVAVLLKDSGAKAAFVSTRAQYEKVEAVRAQTSIEQIVMMDDGPAPDAVNFASLLQYAADGKRDEEFDRCAEAVAPGDLATLIYTSGTTGEPKGVMLTHGNIASNLNYSLAEIPAGPEDSCISFLPLSHITARHLDYALFAKGATVAYCPKFDTLPQAMVQVKPTMFVGVPRVYEKVRQAVEQKSAGSPVKKKLLHWAMAVGRRHLEEISEGKMPEALDWRLAQRLIYSKIAKAFGGRVRIFIAGGAPLGMDTASWFGAVGIRILEGYGLTETSPVLALNTPVAYRMGSVGRPLPNVQCRIAEDGELLVKGPNVFVGYWQKPEDTAESFEDGWFKTGDIARLDEDGFLYVTDRKKELLKTSGGKMIAPQPIEGKLKGHLLVAQAAVVGDKHKFAAALISPNFAALEAWAVQQGVKAGSRRELVDHPVVLAAYQVIVDQVNDGLAGYETIKRFRLVPDEWALETGELTPSLKLKRRVINEKYSAEIADLYKDEAVAHG